MNLLFRSQISIYERANGIAYCDSNAPHFAAWRLCVNLLFRRICQLNGYGIIGNALAAVLYEPFSAVEKPVPSQ